jgi:membrane protein
MWLAWLQEKLFARKPSSLRGLWGRAVRGLRILWFALRELRRDHCAERAATMAFVTIISLIPLAVLFVSFAGQLGYGDEFIAYAKREIFPLVAPDFQDRLEVWLDQHISRDVFAQGLGSLVGLIALVSLLVSAVAIFATAERNFDRVWKVDRSRSYLQRIMAFWVTLTTSPFIIAASAGVSDFSGVVRDLAAKSIILTAVYGFIVPVTIGFFGFALIYYFVPSARVRIASAMAGAVVAALLWDLSRRTFFLYVARSLTLYRGLAVVPLFLIWVYLNWFIALLGCEIAYAHQNLDVLTDLLDRPGKAKSLSPALIAVELLRRVGRAFFRGARPPRLLSVARDLGARPSDVEDAARRLARAGFLVEHLDEPGLYSLAKAPEAVPLEEVVSLFFAADVPPDLAALDPGPTAGPEDPAHCAFRRARTAYVGTFSGRSLKDVIGSHGHLPGEDSSGGAQLH